MVGKATAGAEVMVTGVRRFYGIHSWETRREKSKWG